MTVQSEQERAELDNAEESNVAQDGPCSGRQDNRGVKETRSLQDARNRLGNEGLLATMFPWIFMFGKVGLAPGGGVNMELRKRLLLQYDRRAKRSGYSNSSTRCSDTEHRRTS